MFTKKIELFSILGFRVSLDYSWFLLLILIVWSLAKGYFPAEIEGLSEETALLLGVGGAFGLFFSIIFHEFSHAIVARRFDIPIAGITLFVFGGVAEMEKEPPSAKSEFLMAIAGPIASYVLAIVFYAVSLSLPEATAEAPMAVVFSYLALINTILATFNLIPAFPLDGGRVLRAAIWWRTGDLHRATATAAASGRFFGTFLMIMGVLSIITGNFVAGMWQALLGLFIIGAARSSEMHMMLTQFLQNVPVSRLMVPHPVTVPAETPVDEMIETYFYRYSHKVFPVIRDGVLLGCVSLDDVGRTAREDRARLTAGEVLSPGSRDRTVSPGMSVLEALDVMRRQGASRLMVTVGGTLVGMLTMRDIMAYVSVRRELSGGDHPPRGARPSDQAH